MKTKILIPIFICSLFLIGCKEETTFDLVIENATILDVKTGKITKNKSILINNGIIKKIVASSDKNIAIKRVDAKNKLITPSFIDTHVHPMNVFGDDNNAPTYLKKDSINYLRSQFTKTYLPYGVTTTFMLGHPESWLHPILKWQNEKRPHHTDIYTSGAALISDEDEEPYIGHVELKNVKEAKQKVIEYSKKGIKTLKLYFNLRKPEFIQVLKTADSLNIKVFGHVGDYSKNRISINEAVGYGLKNFEHIPTLPFSVLEEGDWEKMLAQFMKHYGNLDSKEKMMMIPLELFRYVNENRKSNMIELIDSMSKGKTSISTSIGILYRHAISINDMSTNSKVFTPKQSNRNKENFKIMIKYLKLMLKKDINIRIGTDTENGGKVFLFEMFLMSQHGVSMIDVFKIATINGANTMMIDEHEGVIETGKNANLIIWKKNPFLNNKNLFGLKTVIKNGVIYK